jgi:hypothetical protein
VSRKNQIEKRKKKYRKNKMSVLNQNISKEELKSFRDSQPNYLIRLLEAFPDGIEVKSTHPVKRVFPRKNNWQYDYLSENPNITWDYVRAHLDKDWDFSGLSGNPSITWEIIKNNPTYPWDEYCLSFNPNITWEIVQANPDYPWQYTQLSKNPNITWDIVKNNLEKDWYFPWLSQNRNFTPEIVKENPGHNWDMRSPVINPKVKNYEQKIDYFFTLEKCNDPWMQARLLITSEIIRENPNVKWNFHTLSLNKFLYNEELCIQEYNKAVQRRKEGVFPVVKNVLYKDVSSIIKGYVGFD